MRIIGIDYSISCPCISFGNAFSFVTSNKKTSLHSQRDGLLIKGKLRKLTTKFSDVERFDETANLLTEDWLNTLNPGIAVFEGYAFAGNGLTRIAESTYNCKLRLYDRGWQIATITPSEVKKITTKNGNANKEKMAEAWKQEFGWYLHEHLGCDIKGSPATDIIDSHYVRKSYIKEKL